MTYFDSQGTTYNPSVTLISSPFLYTKIYLNPRGALTYPPTYLSNAPLLKISPRLPHLLLLSRASIACVFFVQQILLFILLSSCSFHVWLLLVFFVCFCWF